MTDCGFADGRYYTKQITETIQMTETIHMIHMIQMTEMIQMIQISRIDQSADMSHFFRSIHGFVTNGLIHMYLALSLS